MATNWPPVPNPWPPPELGPCEFSDRATFEDELTKCGFTWRNPTTEETNLWFKNVRCDEGHQINGFIVVSPSNGVYPFAYCVSASHRTVLALWHPYDIGSMSNNR